MLLTGAFFMAPGAEAQGITFKSAKAPGQKMIDVQITPEEDWYKRVNREKTTRETVPKAAAETAAPAKIAAKSDLSDWFWGVHSPDLAAADFARLDAAVTTVARSTKARTLAPRISTYQTLADRHGKDILLATLGKDISPALVLAVMGVESSGRADAVSEAGATGLMQLMEDTAERFDVVDRTDPKQSIRGGAAYLAWLLKEFKGDPLLALAGYNAGEGAVRKHSGVPPYPETRAYVPKVVAAWQVARSLCMTPPKYPTDGCVFRRSVSQ
ncbi:MAG: lytic transglycosylase domain-containing protein [Pseudomonadota bacterium]